MEKEEIFKIQGWLQYKNIIPIEKIDYVDHDVLDIHYLRIYDMFEDIKKLLNVGIKFSAGPGIKNGFYIEIILDDMDWDSIMKRGKLDET